MKAIVIAVVLLLAGSAEASPIKVNFYESTSPVNILGTFTGEDTNNDGMLVLSELTNWWISYSPIDTVANLNAFGDYHIAANVWDHNAASMPPAVTDAYATWDTYMSLSMHRFAWQITTVQDPAQAPLPLPGSLALGAIGALALGMGRRRRR